MNFKKLAKYGCLLLFAMACCSVAGQAQSIKFYNAQNHEISPTQPYPYDRLERGEFVRVVITAPSYPARLSTQYYTGLTITRSIFSGLNYTTTIPPYGNDVYTLTWGSITLRRQCPIGKR